MEFQKIQKEIFNPISENVKKLAELFPSAVKDGQVDFEALKAELGQFETVSKKLSERYELGWAGKEDAKRLASTDIVGRTLKYIPEDSKNPDTTENLYIEGDNLEVLKLLRNSYYSRIKMIYIDPPYNTGNDFVYRDDFKVSEEENAVSEGEIDQYGERLIVNQKSSGKYHSNWLSMMYPRLKVAKDLLTEDGVIFISIDDNEVDNLKKLCDEVLGNNNFIAILTREAIKGGSVSKFLRVVHDYVLIYAKNILSVTFGGIETEGLKLDREDEKGKYAKGRELNKWGAGSRREDAPGMWYPIPGPNGEDVYPIRNDGSEGRWRLGKGKLFKLVNDGNVIFEKRDDGTYIVYEKIRDDSPKIKQFTTLFKDEYINAKGTEEIKRLFESERAVFDYSKPINLIYDLMLMSNVNDGDIVLDFFSGSATTAHAVMQLNAEDGGNRKFIMVQLPEPCDEKSEAYKAGFKNICEIGKERIRRAGEKIKEENKDKEGIENLDIGFKVFRVADTNIRWFSEAMKSDIMTPVEELINDKDRLDFNPGFTDIDVVYEILLRHRDIPLSANVEKLASIGERTYIFADTVVVCLEQNVTESMIDRIAAIEPMPMKIIFRDSAFGDDITLKTNSMLRLEAQMKKNSGSQKKAYRVEFI